jgi:cytidine deaminase
MAKQETKNISTSYDVYVSINDLEEKDQFLLEKAREAMENAYAPYSKFKVGAAVDLDNGIIITGNNQENSAYPSGLCAERTAVFYASSQYPHQKISSIAVIAQNNSVEPVSPCGACRQALAEYELKFKHPIRVILGSSSGKVYVLNSVESLLPLMFGNQSLK